MKRIWVRRIMHGVRILILVAMKTPASLQSTSCMNRKKMAEVRYVLSTEKINVLEREEECESFSYW